MTERDQRLQEIRDRYEASTQGEWTPDTMGHEEICIDGVPLEIIFEELPNRDIPRDVYGHLLEPHPDLEFIAHAHQDVPWLLDEIERLESELEVANHYAELAG